MKLTETVAVVTGGASGLGEACVRNLVAGGARVAILDLDADRGERLARDLNGAAHFARADATSESDVSAALDACQSAFGRVTAAINCAGIAVAVKTIGKAGAHPLALYRKVLDVNLTGTFNVCRLAAERMQANLPDENGERGAIVLTASVAAFDGQKGQAAYASSKGGIVALTLPMARDLADVGIRVNTVAPGLFLTPMMESLPQPAQDALAHQPLFPKRLGKPSELASLVRFLVECPYINAETIRLDGGARLP